MTFSGATLVALLALAAQAPLAGKERERAIAGIHHRAAGAVPGSPEARRLSGDLEQIGAAYLAEGQVGPATELFSEAYALDEENGLVLAELTLCYVRAGDFDSAHFYLLLAEDRVTRAPPEIYGVLGEVYAELHRLEDAVRAWEESVRFGGDAPAFLRRLVRAREELALSRGQRSVDLERFSIFADAAISEEIVGRVAEDLEGAYRSQAAFLGARLEGPQVVILYAGRSYFSLVSAPDWVSGLFDGKIRLSVEPEAPAPAAMSSVLAHELAHALIRLSSRGRAPAWLQEGLAQWCEGRRLSLGEIRAAVGARPAISLEGLDESFGRKLDRPAARASYAQALSLVDYLITLRGSGTAACLLTRLGGEDGSFSDALGAETGMSPAEFLAGWRKWAGLSEK